MVIPAGRPVYLDLESVGGLIGGATKAEADYAVIHSFWIPELAGKQDVVPNRTNHILMQADEPGTFFGQCAEFCGLQHGKMKVRVVALSQSDWEAWVANHQQPGVTPTDPLATQGMDLFMNPLSGDRGTCIACHTIGGINSGVNAAPNLTHFADPTHQCFAGLRLGDDRHRGPHGLAPRSQRRQARVEDAQLPPDRRRDRGLGGLPRRA